MMMEIDALPQLRRGMLSNLSKATSIRIKAPWWELSKSLLLHFPFRVFQVRLILLLKVWRKLRLIHILISNILPMMHWLKILRHVWLIDVVSVEATITMPKWRRIVIINFSLFLWNELLMLKRQTFNLFLLLMHLWTFLHLKIVVKSVGLYLITIATSSISKVCSMLIVVYHLII